MELTDVIPASIGLQLRPGLAPTTDFGQSLKDLQIERLESGNCTIQACMANRFEISEAHRLRYEAGDKTAPRRLLEINPEFGRESWMQDWLADPAALEESLRRGAGRPAGKAPSSEWREMLIVAYVDATRAGTGLSLNAVFKKLGDEGRIGLSVSRIRDVYYGTRNGRRAFLFT